MSLSAEERQKGIRPLTKDNYLVWSEMIKDYILCLDCEDAEDIWEAAWWDHDAAVKAARAAADEAGDDAEPDPVEDPADDYNALPSSSAAAKKTKTCHAKAFAYIRRSLSPPIFEKTLGHKTNLPKLLRMLKNCWNDNTTQDRDRMRTEFDNMRLSDLYGVSHSIYRDRGGVVALASLLDPPRYFREVLGCIDRIRLASPLNRPPLSVRIEWEAQCECTYT